MRSSRRLRRGSSSNAVPAVQGPRPCSLLNAPDKRRLTSGFVEQRNHFMPRLDDLGFLFEVIRNPSHAIFADAVVEVAGVCLRARAFRDLEERDNFEQLAKPCIEAGK